MKLGGALHFGRANFGFVISTGLGSNFPAFKLDDHWWELQLAVWVAPLFSSSKK
jgi:hypothetical protein